MKERMIDSMLFPILAVLVIAAYAGGLGIIFMVIEGTGAGIWGVIVLGVAIVVGVPSAAAMFQKMAEKE